MSEYVSNLDLDLDLDLDVVLDFFSRIRSKSTSRTRSKSKSRSRFEALGDGGRLNIAEPLPPHQRFVFDPVRLLRRGAQPALSIGLVLLVVPFEPNDL